MSNAPVSTSSSIWQKLATNAAGCAVSGRLSFAEPTRPVPARFFTDAAVIGFTPAGGS